MVTKLFQPIQIGNVQLKNRLVFPPLTTGYEDRGMITEKCIHFYASLARGGAGLIILGDVAPVKVMSPVPALYDDSFIPGLQKLTAAVHQYGARIGAQIFHPEYSPEELMQVMMTQGKEAVFKKLHEDMENFCNRISVEEIGRIQDKFVEGALRAKAAGFDLIQIHGDRIIGMFSSPILNKRTDAYGGSLENRARFALETVAKIRAAVPDLAIDYKLAIIRTDPPKGKGGPTLAEAQVMAGWLANAGVDSFHVCLANHGSISDTLPPAGSVPMGCFVDLAEGIKQVTNLPVTAVGRIIDPEHAEEILEAGQADLIALGRQFVCDPEWPQKALTGRAREIRYCIMCNRGCTDHVLKRLPVECALNAASGLECDPEWKPVETPKRVVVVGGGPAGLEVARIAAGRGHQVTVLEKQTELGGQLRIAAVPPHKAEMGRITEYLKREVERLGVEVRTGVEANAELVLALQPDEIVLATGAKPLIPAVAGCERGNVVTAWDVLAGQVAVPGEVVVIGGGSVGVETAEFLAEQGAAVTIVEMLERVGADESPTVLPMIQKFLQDHQVTVLTSHTLQQVNSDSIVVQSAGGETTVVPCELVVMAVGAKPERELANELQQRGIAFRMAGDCSQDHVRLLRDAIREGFKTGLEL